MKTQKKNAAKKKAKAPAVKKAKAVAKGKSKKMAAGAKKATKKKAAPSAKNATKKKAVSAPKSKKASAKKQAPKTAKAEQNTPELKIPGKDLNFIPKPAVQHQISPLEAHDAETKFQHREEVAFHQENQKMKNALASRKNLNRFTHRERNK